MAEHDAPFAHVAYQQPDGTTGVMDNCDELAIHDHVGAVKEMHIADGAVTNGKIAAGAVTSAELADGAVTAQTIADGAVGRDQLDPELVESWDSVSHFKQIVSIEVSGGVQNPGATADRTFSLSSYGFEKIPLVLGAYPKAGQYCLPTVYPPTNTQELRLDFYQVAYGYASAIVVLAEPL